MPTTYTEDKVGKAIEDHYYGTQGVYTGTVANSIGYQDYQTRHSSPYSGSRSVGSSNLGEALAYLVMGGLALIALLGFLLLVIFVYQRGLATYIYLLKALVQSPSTAVLGVSVLFTIAQVVPFLLFVKSRKLVIAPIYIIALPALGVAAAALTFWVGDLLVGVGIDVLGVVEALGAMLPRNVPLPFGVAAHEIAYGLPAGLLGVAIAIPTYFALRVLTSLFWRGLVYSMRVSASATAGARATPRGQIVLASIGLLSLTAVAWLAPLPVAMPLGIQTFPVVLLGMVFGWRIASLATAGWLTAALVSLPVAGNASLDAAGVFGPHIGFAIGLVAAAVVSGWRSGDMSLGERVMLAFGANLVFVFAGMLGLWQLADWSAARLGENVFIPSLLGIALSSLLPAVIVALGSLVHRAAVEAT